jgi:predicted RNA-binding Zn-ribbon protein involved in translation (DUF1610 family)
MFFNIKEKQCSECGINFKPTNNRQFACLACGQIREIRLKKERRHKDPTIMERQRLATAKWRVEHPEKARESGRLSDLKRQDSKRQYAKELQRIKRQDPNYRKEQAKQCQKWRLLNKETINTEARKRYQTDLQYQEECKEQARNWARRNPERVKENCRRWAELNFDKVTVRNHRGRTSWDLDPTLIRSIYEYYNYTCVYCNKRGGKLSLEHILPVSRGGSDDFDNLAVACRKCNPTKGKKTLLEFILWH